MYFFIFASCEPVNLQLVEEIKPILKAGKKMVTEGIETKGKKPIQDLSSVMGA